MAGEADWSSISWVSNKPKQDKTNSKKKSQTKTTKTHIDAETHTFEYTEIP